MKKYFTLTVALLAGLALLTSAVLNNGLSVGDKAPDFKLKNIDGEMYSLSTIKDAEGNTPKGYIVTFTCNTCPFAKMYEDRLISLHNEMAPRGWPVVAIQPNDPEIMPGDSFENMKKRAEDKGFPFVYLLDEKQEVYPAYGAERTPHIFLLDAERTVRYIGAIDDNPQNAGAVNRKYVKEAIAAIESGKEVEPKTTKAIGCSIKSK